MPKKKKPGCDRAFDASEKVVLNQQVALLAGFAVAAGYADDGLARFGRSHFAQLAFGQGVQLEVT